MTTKIGINVLCKTAKQQHIFIETKECRAYYESCFEHSILSDITKIIRKYTTFDFNISCTSEYLKDDVLNSILIEIYNATGFDKQSCKKELTDFINNYFISKCH